MFSRTLFYSSINPHIHPSIHLSTRPPFIEFDKDSLLEQALVIFKTLSHLGHDLDPVQSSAHLAQFIAKKTAKSI